MAGVASGVAIISEDVTGVSARCAGGSVDVATVVACRTPRKQRIASRAIREELWMFMMGRVRLAIDTRIFTSPALALPSHESCEISF